MPSSNANDSSKSRVALHRTKVAAVGSRRVEVTVPTSGAALVKSVAETLRSGGKRAALMFSAKLFAPNQSRVSWHGLSGRTRLSSFSRL